MKIIFELMSSFEKMDPERLGYVLEVDVEKHFRLNYGITEKKFSKQFSKYYTLNGFRYSPFLRKIFRLLAPEKIKAQR
jgi:hypothetical protein